MNRFTPRSTLLLLLVVAAVILSAGLRLARREETVRLPQNREYLQQLAQSLQRETEKLVRLYESHLRSLAREVDEQQKYSVQEPCDRVVGILQFSWVGPQQSRKNIHVVISPSRGPRLPEPVFETSVPPDSGNPAPLPTDLLSAAPGESGWVEDPGKPLFFWLRRPSGQFAVLLIDSEAVGAAMDSGLAAWMRDAWPSAAPQGGVDELYGSRGAALSGSRRPLSETAAADFLLPIQTRFGVWQLASWDRRELRASYHTPTLVFAIGLSIIVALAGLIVSAQQRRALRHAEQRVSFVNRVSHELRAPLTNILLNLDLTRELLDDEVAGEATHGLDIATEEARRLSRLIANVLTFSQIERGSPRPPLRACLPAAVLSAVVEQFTPLFARRSLSLTFKNETTHACLLDGDALAQIVGNLLSNVEKYVPGGEVEISSRYDDGDLVVTVDDNGPGIPCADAERIFLPFERLENSVNEGATGAGLGLAIARELATAMHGELRSLSSPKGARFELRVPGAALPAPASVSASAVA